MRRKRYYDPGRDPKPRKLDEVTAAAPVGKMTRQLRRAMERANAKAPACKMCGRIIELCGCP